MPKKFGTNTKAQEANERKTTAKKESQAKEKKAKEDSLWEDNDKSVIEKEKKRKAAEDKKAAEALRKAQNRELLAKEAEELNKSSKQQVAAKVTRAEIDKRKEIEAYANAKREQKEKEKIKEEEIEENTNRIFAEEKAKVGEGYVEARSVGDAIDKLSIDETKDRHPEKRLKAAFTAYEAINLPRLRDENPGLKRSQVKDLLWKEWLKSPENPLNQPQ